MQSAKFVTNSEGVVPDVWGKRLTMSAMVDPCHFGDMFSGFRCNPSLVSVFDGLIPAAGQTDYGYFDFGNPATAEQILRTFLPLENRHREAVPDMNLRHLQKMLGELSADEKTNQLLFDRSNGILCAKTDGTSEFVIASSYGKGKHDWDLRCPTAEEMFSGRVFFRFLDDPQMNKRWWTA